MAMESTEERLKKLETKLACAERRSRYVLTGVGMTIVVCAVIWVALSTAGRAQAQKPSEAEKVIRANKFIVEDESGKTRAVLSVTSTGAGLSLFDESGRTRAVLDVIEGGAKLWLCGDDGKPRAALAGADRLTALMLSDRNAKPRASLTLLEFEGGPKLRLSDETGRPRAVLAVSKDTQGLAFFDEQGRQTWGSP